MEKYKNNIEKESTIIQQLIKVYSENQDKIIIDERNGIILEYILLDSKNLNNILNKTMELGGFGFRYGPMGLKAV